MARIRRSAGSQIAKPASAAAIAPDSHYLRRSNALRTPAQADGLVAAREISSLHKDPTNPRKSDPARMGLLRLSLKKLGFIQPVFALPNGMLLSGHQRTTTALELGFKTIPVITVEVPQKDVAGINILFNRATNDFTAFDTGTKAAKRLDLDTVIAAAEALPDFEGENWYAINCTAREVSPYVKNISDQYDKKAVALALGVLRQGIRIPIVVSEDGRIVNGIHRAFAALENGETVFPTIVIPNDVADVALNFLNYLSMDFHIDEDFKNLVRYSAYRRPQNNRGAVPKSMRFWANGNRTLADKDSYTQDYWRKFRDIHGLTILDYGAGLCKAAPYLQTKGINALDYEPYRIDPEADNGVPSPAYSKQQAKRFLDAIGDVRLRFDSIFLSSVLNSVPLPEDRLALLAIVHALSTRATAIYGTCRDMSDFNYEYGGIRVASYFTFDSEPGVRVGDVMRAPKIQKFMTQEEADTMFRRFWKGREYWPGGNIFYWKLTAPIGINPMIVGKAIESAFDMPYADGTRMGLVDYAKQQFSKRLMTKIP